MSRRAIIKVDETMISTMLPQIVPMGLEVIEIRKNFHFSYDVLVMGEWLPDTPPDQEPPLLELIFTTKPGGKPFIKEMRLVFVEEK